MYHNPWYFKFGYYLFPGKLWFTLVAIDLFFDRGYQEMAKSENPNHNRWRELKSELRAALTYKREDKNV